MTTINTRDINACYPKGWGPTASINIHDINACYPTAWGFMVAGTQCMPRLIAKL